MPSYRVETALSRRAGCVETQCKAAGIKIEKDELRLGTWVAYEETGSFKYKHWGCVSGFQIKSIREYLDPEDTGDYEWDKLDGYDDEGKGGLVSQPDLQEKVRRVITQGFIDPEDFNGDPEMNVLGEKGIYTAATKRKKKEEQKQANESAEAEAEAGVSARVDEKAAPPKAHAKKKRARQDTDSADENDLQPAPKKRASKAKKEENELDDIKPKAPAQKGRKKMLKNESPHERSDLEDVEEKPKIKRERKVAVKPEVGDDFGGLDSVPEVKPKGPNKRARKTAVKPELEDDMSGVAPETKPKASIKRGRKADVKTEEGEGTEGLDDLSEVQSKAPRKKGRKSAVKTEVDEEMGTVEAKPKNKAPPRNGRKKPVKEEPTANDTEDVEGGLEDYKSGDEVKSEPTQPSSSLSAIQPAEVALEAEDKMLAPNKNGDRSKSRTSTRVSRARTTSKN